MPLSIRAFITPWNLGPSMLLQRGVFKQIEQSNPIALLPRMIGARRAALAAVARLARQSRCFSALRAVYPSESAPAVPFTKQGELSFSRSFAAAAEPAPEPATSKGTVKTVRRPQGHCHKNRICKLGADPALHWHARSSPARKGLETICELKQRLTRIMAWSLRLCFHHNAYHHG